MTARLALLGAAALTTAAGCAEDRVAEARRLKGAELKRMAAAQRLPSPIPRLYFRAFKQERQLEVWGASAEGRPMVLVRRYAIAGMSGGLGPKLKEGDRQVPEGFYHIDRFNPRSRFLLSLGINYPNDRDRRVADQERPGGDIFIHGDTASIGCLAMTDDLIREIYLLALDARKAGQGRIPVHIFPFRMDQPTWRQMERQHRNRPELLAFWKTLRPAFLGFEQSRIVPRTRVDRRTGAYVVTPAKQG